MGEQVSGAAATVRIHRSGMEQANRRAREEVGPKIRVTMEALIGRINRKLRRRGERLKTLRGDRDLRTIGRYYCVSGQSVTRTRIDPVQLGREVRALRPWETVEEE